MIRPALAAALALGALGCTSETNGTGPATLVFAGRPSAGTSPDGGDRDAGAIPDGALLCGRFVVTNDGKAAPSQPCPAELAVCNGAGLVFDRDTGLTWMRFMYAPAADFPTLERAEQVCADRGMRVPTAPEAVAIAGPADCLWAWPEGWLTWTTTPSTPGTVTAVAYGGDTVAVHPNERGPVLCVR